MSESSQSSGGSQPGIPQEAIDDAMRSVERGNGADAPPTAGTQSPEGQRIEKLEALLAESTSRAAQTADRLKDTHERYLRVAADFDNWKKRAAKEREDTVRFGNERLLKDVLPVVDNLERALASASSDASTLLEGVRLVLKQFVDTLQRHQVKSFSAVGEPFDPARHEALMQQESDAPANTVISEMSKGYLLNDRLIRPAAVVVSKGRPDQREAAPGGADRQTGADEPAPG